jgi:PAS domain S-box-containing protein
MVRDPALAQAFLAQRPRLPDLFNGGALIVNEEGTAVAEVRPSAGRIGLNFAEVDVVASVLGQGRAVIGRPVIGGRLTTPVFGMAAPIRDPAGKVIGGLLGLTDVSKPNFLDRLAGGRHGRSGYFLVEEPQGRLTITGTDKSRVMQHLPGPGRSALIDRHLQGSDETGVTVNPLGVEVLASAARIPATGWFLVAALPTEEAFAPIHDLARLLTLAALALMIVAGGLTWWMLWRQFSPLVATAQTLGGMVAGADRTVPRLAVTRQDEIGLLIGAFNRLLETLRSREEALQASENRFRILVECAPEAVGVHRDGKLLYVNPAAVTLFGAKSAHDLVGTAIMDRVHPDFRAIVVERVKAADRGSGVMPMIVEKFIKLDGTVIDAEVQNASIVYDGAPAIYVALTDITVRQRHEDAFKKFFEQPMGLHLIAQGDGVIRRVSQGWSHVLGYAQEELAGLNFLELVHPDDRAATVAEMAKLAEGITTFTFENRYRCKQGGYRVLNWSANYAAADQLIYGLGVDVTERRRVEEALQSSLREKQSLLKEVHHRVKNNLQVIMSLLRLESGRSEHLATKSVLQEMQGRIRSMALLHETLYRTDDFSAVDLAAYLKQLSTQLHRAVGVRSGVVRIELNLAAVRVEIDRAIPCGLIANELISNSFKHGFPAGRAGEIRIELQPVAGGPQVRLAVSDTGVGLPADFELKRMQSLGMQLVSDLVRQLDATLEIGPGPGADFRIVFTPGDRAGGVAVQASAAQAGPSQTAGRDIAKAP